MKIFYAIIFGACFLMYADYASGGPVKKRKIKRLFKHSKVLNDHFTGFALYDLDKGKMIYAYNADKYFTPASNTKLFTFYTCLRMLGDSIPALKYVQRNDSLIFWGTGDPSFLHSDLKGVNGFNFLKNSARQLYFAAGQYKGGFYGDGWAWNDYNDYYMAEISELPIENNVVKIVSGDDSVLHITPRFFSPDLKWAGDKPGYFRIKRNFLDNTFIYSQAHPPKNFVQYIPWKPVPK